jgi:glycosyltransferase involved in cell wall biosynthesis
MPAAVYVVPGRLDQRTGGSIYNRRMVEALRDRGWTMTVVELDGAFPEPCAEARSAAVEAFSAVAAGSIVLVDGLAFSALPEVGEAHRDRVTLVAVVHLPIAAAFGVEGERAARYEADERRAFAAARSIVITGPGAWPLVARYGIPAGRVSLVEPGTDAAPLAHGSAGDAVEALAVATVHPGKGHDLLLTALEKLRDFDWALTCAGSLTRDAAFVEQLRDRAARAGLEARIRFLGDVPADRLEACYDAADLFVLATRQETYGMAVAEALARGLPVVSTETGAIPELVGQDAGLLVPPGDGDGLTAALRTMLTDDDLRQRLATGARRRRSTLPTWPSAAAKLALVLEGACGRG